MQLNLGMKIRELRHRDGRTQEMLADALGITSQAVSRWESGGSYPDMEMIPSIANYFGITIDELFGYENNREQKIQAILEKAYREIRAIGGFLGKGNGDLSECVELLRTATEEFPEEPRILLKLGDALYFLGWQKMGIISSSNEDSDYFVEDTDYNSQNIYWKEALQIFEKLLNMKLTNRQQGNIVSTLIRLYQHFGKYEKARSLADNQTSLFLSREVLLPQATTGEENEQYLGELIIMLLTELNHALSNSVLCKTSSAVSDYGTEVLLSLIQLIETVFQDGRCGLRHMDLRYLYLTLANLEARSEKNMEKALFYFDKGFEHYKEYLKISKAGEYKYTAPLVSRVSLTADQIQPVPDFFWQNHMQTVPDILKDVLKKNNKYAECFA